MGCFHSGNPLGDGFVWLRQNHYNWVLTKSTPQMEAILPLNYLLPTLTELILSQCFNTKQNVEEILPKPLQSIK